MDLNVMRLPREDRARLLEAGAIVAEHNVFRGLSSYFLANGRIFAHEIEDGNGGIKLGPTLNTLFPTWKRFRSILI
jgi:hypothetical protein